MDTVGISSRGGGVTILKYSLIASFFLVSLFPSHGKIVHFCGIIPSSKNCFLPLRELGVWDYRDKNTEALLLAHSK